MLPEIVSGMIETRHIVTPVRSFCKKANYFEAGVKAIDLENKKVSLSHTIGRQNIQRSVEQHDHTLKYDYLVIAMGSENNFFGNKDIEENSFTMKTINDAITLRNHI